MFTLCDKFRYNLEDLPKPCLKFITEGDLIVCSISFIDMHTFGQ